MSRSVVDIDEQEAVQVIWVIGLAVAVVATLVLLKEVSLVLRALLNIRHLAEVTRQAAAGIARNVTAVAKLSATKEPVGQIGSGSEALASTAASIERKITSVLPAPAGRGG